MSDDKKPNLVLALGNDILGDDAVGLIAARQLKLKRLEGVDIIESSEAGFALLELIEGYKQLLILDSVVTGKNPPGTILELTMDDFEKVAAPSPHYSGLPDIQELAMRLEISFPEEIRILAMEVENAYEVKEGLSASVESSVSHLVIRAQNMITEWVRSRK